MKKQFLLLLAFIGFTGWGMVNAQSPNLVRAQLMLPSGIQFARGQEHQLQVQLSGFNGDQEYLRTRTVDVNTVPGVIQFNLILDDDNHNGYFDLRFSSSTKAEFETMLREIFCRLNVHNIIVNDSEFADCRLVTVPM